MNLLRLPFLVKLTLVVISIIGLATFFHWEKYFSSVFSGIFNGDAFFAGCQFSGEKIKISRSMSTIASVLMMLLILTGLIYFFRITAFGFSKDIPHLKQQFTSVAADIQHWVSRTFHVKIDEQLIILIRA
jgi:predicted PurR-regulated permease PerM